MVITSKPQKLSTKFQLKERGGSFQTTSVPSSCMCQSSSLVPFPIVSTVSAGCKLQQLPAPQCLQLTLVRSATCHFHPLKPVYMKAIHLYLANYFWENLSIPEDHKWITCIILHDSCFRTVYVIMCIMLYYFDPMWLFTFAHFQYSSF